jgi:hypothetical protein
VGRLLGHNVGWRVALANLLGKKDGFDVLNDRVHEGLTVGEAIGFKMGKVVGFFDT